MCFNKTKYTKLVFHLLLFYKCLGFAWLRIFCFVCLDGKIAVTAVDSGIRALQFLGLDEQRRTSESDGFVVCITRIFISLYFHEILFSIAYFSAVDDITESQSVLVILSRLIGEASTLGEEVGEDDGDGEETEGDDESVEVDGGDVDTSDVSCSSSFLLLLFISTPPPPPPSPPLQPPLT